MKHCLLWPPSLCSAAAGWSSLLSSSCGTALVSLPPWVDSTCIAIDLYLFLHSKTSDTGIKQFITKMHSVGISPGEISSDSSHLLRCASSSAAASKDSASALWWDFDRLVLPLDTSSLFQRIFFNLSSYLYQPPHLQE